VFYGSELSNEEIALIDSFTVSVQGYTELDNGKAHILSKNEIIEFQNSENPSERKISLLLQDIIKKSFTISRKEHDMAFNCLCLREQRRMDTPEDSDLIIDEKYTDEMPEETNCQMQGPKISM
jgi:hypothetical protein